MRDDQQPAQPPPAQAPQEEAAPKAQQAGEPDAPRLQDLPVSEWFAQAEQQDSRPPVRPNEFIEDKTQRRDRQQEFNQEYRQRGETRQRLNQDRVQSAKYQTTVNTASGETIYINIGDQGILPASGDQQTPLRYWEIAAETLAEISEVFVPKATCDRARTVLARDRVVFLQDLYDYYEGPHLALKILRDMLAGAGCPPELYALDPRYPLHELPNCLDGNALPGSGFLVQNRAAEPFAQLDTADISFLTGKLRERGAYLVITTNHRAYLDTQGRERYTVRVELEDFPEDARPAYTPESGLRAIKRWFEENSAYASTDDRIYLTTLAMLSRCEPAAIHQGYERLKEILDYIPPEDAPPAVLNEPIQQRLDRMKAARIKAQVNTEYGKTQLNVVVFPRYGYRQSLLWYLWEEFDRERDRLIGWMQEMIHAQDRQRRRAVAEAIGLLAARHFPAVVDAFLRPLALLGLQNPEYQDVLGIALWIAAGAAVDLPESASVAPSIRKLLNHWATQKENASLALASIVAYRWTGGFWPQDAIRSLGKMVEAIKSFALVIPIAEALRAIAHDRWSDEEAPDLDLIAKLVILIRRWLKHEHPAVQQTGAMLFTFLSLTTVLHAEVDGEPGRSPHWSLPIEAAYRSGNVRRALGKLLSSLVYQNNRESAYAIITSWLWMNVGDENEGIKQVTDPGTFYETLLSIIRVMLAAGPNPARIRRECDHFDRQLQRWQRQRGRLGQLARRIQRDLSQPAAGYIPPHTS